VVQRPLDLLNRALGSLIPVGLEGGREFGNKLVGFDMHLNLLLENAEEIRKGKVTKRYGIMVIRGDNVIFTSPEVV
jgi:small nuclear ribonucleoprotein (snRNP)-like protein